MIVSLFLCLAFTSAAVGDASAPLEERLKRLVQARTEMEAQPGTLEKQRQLQRRITRIETQLRKKPDGGARPMFDVTRATSAVTSDGDTKLSASQALLARILPPAPDVARQKVERQHKRETPQPEAHPTTPRAQRRPQGQIIDGDAPQPAETRLAAPAKPVTSAESRVGWGVRPPVLPIPQGMGGSVALAPQMMMASPPQGAFPHMGAYHQGVHPQQAGRLPERPPEKTPCSFDPQGLVAVWDSPAYPYQSRP